MNRRTPWSAGIDADDIPTPVHARTSWQASLASRESREKQRSTQIESVPTQSMVPWSLIIAMGFLLFLILFFYQSEYFIPVAVTGSIGVAIMSFVILSDKFQF